jgi:hypothetical protein
VYLGIVGIVVLLCCACIGTTALKVNDERRTRKATFLCDVMGRPPIDFSGLEAAPTVKSVVESSSLGYATSPPKGGHIAAEKSRPNLGHLSCRIRLEMGYNADQLSGRLGKHGKPRPAKMSLCFWGQLTKGNEGRPSSSFPWSTKNCAAWRAATCGVSVPTPR